MHLCSSGYVIKSSGVTEIASIDWLVVYSNKMETEERENVGFLSRLTRASAVGLFMDSRLILGGVRNDFIRFGRSIVVLKQQF